MSRFLVWVAFIVYLPLCFGSSQPPINLGNFSNQDFTPRGEVIPDQSPSVLSFATTVIEGTTSPRRGIQTLSTNDETLITVTGNVKRFSNPLLNAAGNMTRVLTNASGITVMFWQPQTSGNKRTAVTDENGNYEIALTNGFWRGEACGPGVGYSPNAWEVTLRDNKLIQMQEVSYSAPSITPNQIDVAMLQNTGSPNTSSSTFLKQEGQPLSVNGSGFGCNGSLVFVFYNSVNRCGEESEVEYDHQLIVRNNFASRSDTKISIAMPSLYDATVDQSAQHDDFRRIAKMYYQKGNQRSNAIFVGEDMGVQAFNPESLACNPDQVENPGDDETITDQTAGLEDIGQPGDMVPGNLAGTPFLMMTETAVGTNTAGNAGTAVGGVAAQMAGSSVMTQMDIAVEGDLEITVNTDNVLLNIGR